MEIQSRLINAEALDSQTYNPSTDKAVIQLYQIMATASEVDEDDPEDPVMADFHTAITSLPTDGATRYAGLLTNPITCFVNDIRDILNDLPGLIQEITDNYPDTQPDWDEYEPEFTDDLQEINDDLDTIQEHSDRLTSNLPSLAGIAQAAMALATLLSALSNPCSPLGGFFGSIMDEGKKIMKDVNDQIQGIKNTINDAIQDFEDEVREELGPVIQDIKDQIAIAKEEINKAVDQAKKEISNFAKGLLAQERQGLADFMNGLPKDPCMKSLLGSVKSSAGSSADKLSSLNNAINNSGG